MTAHQITHFGDNIKVPSSLSFSNRDSTFAHAETTDSSLAAFLGRPIRIDSRVWTVGGSLNYSINPWTLFIENSHVVGRLNNFALLRGDLKVKFVINGNSFYYGRAVCAYRPLHDHDNVFTNSTSTTSTDIALMALSQMPGVELDACSSQGGEISCGYLYPSNFMSLPDLDYQHMGVINVRTYQTLEQANGGTDPINITTFAWMENVELHVPTSNAYQSGSLEPGPISGAASSVASLADTLSKVPIIGPYAKATSEVAANVGKFARLFGFSRPNRQGTNIGIVQRPAGTHANVNLDENVSKLSLDAEQELTVDPTTLGLSPRDEMSFKHILSKESYLTQFQWSATDVADNFLFNALITPALSNVALTIPASNTVVGTTPMAHLAALFKYWSGSIKFRFVVVASDFHKGRLRVTVDPTFYDTSGGTDWNTVYTRIIDLSKEREFEITANWMQKTSFAPLPALGTTHHSDTIRYVAHDPGTNGVITVEVLNELTTAATSVTPVSVMVYVSGGDDLRFMAPLDTLDNYSYIDGNYQSGVLNVDDKDEKMTDEVAGTVTVPIQDHLAAVYGGENVVSVRALLKRYWFLRGENRVAGGGNDFAHMRWSYPNFPATRGFLSDGFDTTAALDSYNYNRLTALTYLAPCYVVRRGSIRYKYVVSSSLGGNVRRSLWVTRGNGTYNPATYFAVSAYSGGSGSVSASRQYPLSPTGSGACVTLSNLNPCLEVELPFYSKYRFAFARFIQLNAGSSDDDTDLMSHDTQVLANAVSSENVELQQFVATGEDFALGMYLHSPAVILGANPAA